MADGNTLLGNGDTQAMETVHEKIPCLCSKRWTLAYVSFVGFVLVYAARVNISLAIICMVRPDNNNSSNSNYDVSLNSVNETDTCGTLQKITLTDGEFAWDKSVKSQILAMYFYGYIVNQIPGGWLAGRFGARRVWGSAMALVGVCTVLTPVCARTSVYLLYAVRFLIGFVSGVSFPAMHAMFGRWSPKFERSKLIAFSYAGAPVGIILTFSFSGLLCVYGFDNGWGSIFYLIGGGTLVWVVVWFLVVADTPSEHKSITDEEKEFIENTTGLKGSIKHVSVPWKAMMTSGPLWGIIIAHMCSNFTGYMLLTSLPTFMKEVLKYDIKQNGLLSSLPYVCHAVISVLAGQLADIVREKKILSTIWVRRIWQNIGFWLISAFLVGAGFITCENRIVAVVLLCFSLASKGIDKGGYVVNHVDIAPKYAGILFGITNTAATIPGMVAPVIAGALTPNKTAEEWRNVFYVCAALACTGAIIFSWLASGELQSWARDADVTLIVKPDQDKSDGINERQGDVLAKNKEESV